MGALRPPRLALLLLDADGSLSGEDLAARVAAVESAAAKHGAQLVEAVLLRGAPASHKAQIALANAEADVTLVAAASTADHDSAAAAIAPVADALGFDRREGAAMQAANAHSEPSAPVAKA